MLSLFSLFERPPPRPLERKEGCGRDRPLGTNAKHASRLWQAVEPVEFAVYFPFPRNSWKFPLNTMSNQTNERKYWENLPRHTLPFPIKFSFPNFIPIKQLKWIWLSEFTDIVNLLWKSSEYFSSFVWYEVFPKEINDLWKISEYFLSFVWLDVHWCISKGN